jgi:F0F1-type ATP synthase assembly protein I
MGSAPGGKSSFHSRLGRLSAIVTLLPSTMAAGWCLGHYLLDRPFDISPWGGIVLTLAGAGAGLYETFRMLTADLREGNADPPPSGS